MEPSSDVPRIYIFESSAASRILIFEKRGVCPRVVRFKAVRIGRPDLDRCSKHRRLQLRSFDGTMKDELGQSHRLWILFLLDDSSAEGGKTWRGMSIQGWIRIMTFLFPYRQSKRVQEVY